MKGKNNILNHLKKKQYSHVPAIDIYHRIVLSLLEPQQEEHFKELKNYDKAIVELTKALQPSPNNVMTLNNLGTVYTEMQQFDKAIGYYEKALKLAPAFDIILKNLAVNYLNVGKYAECIAALGKVNIEGDEFLNSLLTEAKRRMAEVK